MRLANYLCCAGVVAGVLLSIVQVQAEDLRIGFVRTDRILKESVDATTAKTKLEQIFSKRDRDLIDQKIILKSLTDKFQIDEPTLSDAQRVTRQKQLTDQGRELQRKRLAFQGDLSTQRNEQLQQVLEIANRAVRQIAAAEKYDLVLQVAAYVNPRLDITDKVLAALNAEKSK